jgi:hypothetical protein
MGLFEEMEDFIFQDPFLPQRVSNSGSSPKGLSPFLFLGFDLHYDAN